MKTVQTMIIGMLSLVLLGCDKRTHKDFSFTEPSVGMPAGLIRGKLRGTMENIDKSNSVNHSPYELLIWFDFGTATTVGNCAIYLEEVVLKNLETDESIDIPDSINAVLRLRSDGAHVASASIKNLNLSYADHDLDFRYQFSNECDLGEVIRSERMEFSKNYSEREITFWDILLGV